MQIGIQPHFEKHKDHGKGLEVIWSGDLKPGSTPELSEELKYWINSIIQGGAQASYFLQLPDDSNMELKLRAAL